jgi:hypothetical protein
MFGMQPLLFHFLLFLLSLAFLVLFLVSSFCGKTQITLPLGSCHLFAFLLSLPLCLSGSRFAASYYLPFILQFFDSIRKILIFSAKALAHLLRPPSSAHLQSAVSEPAPLQT